ncbi:sugar phosphate isomerase/epimerase family protein [Granulosicoccus sp. 3-233]|uniref:sugar phosphate isomerase/epimerase family protein n=1 Tax=Granulosicoccus sp. 3-233 TaxID=3417969 RepID=UPI003D34F76D
MIPVSYQMYSSRHFDLDDTLAMLARLGISAIEGHAPLYEDLQATRRRLDTHGLSMPTGHFSIELVESDPARCLEIARALQVRHVFVPFLLPDQRPSDAEGWQALGRRLTEMSKPILDAGLYFGWHNHDFEFMPCADGSLPIQHLTESCPALGLELDLAWVHVAGQDPVEWIETFADRIQTVHVKDRAADGENTDEDGWADVGYGVMDWEAIAAALKSAKVPLYIMEHDNPRDPERFARRSLATVKNF